MKTSRRVPLALVVFTAFSIAIGEEEPVSPSTELFRYLEGDWTFELGSRTGTRTYALIEPGHAVSWSETFDGIDLTGEGMTTYMKTEGHFVGLSVHNRDGAAGFTLGTPNEDFTKIIYRPQRGESAGKVEIDWVRLDDHAFEFRAFSIANGEREQLWTARFDRRNVSE